MEEFVQLNHQVAQNATTNESGSGAARPLSPSQFAETLRSGIESSHKVRKVPTLGDLFRGISQIITSKA